MPNSQTQDMPIDNINLPSDVQPENDTRSRCPTPEELHEEIEELVTFNSSQLFDSDDFNSHAVIKHILNLKEESEFVSINGLCRFCMSLVTEDYVEIFSQSFEAVNIRAMCKVVLPNKVKLSDGRPSKICRPCISKLEACKLFFEQFLYAENYYKTLIKYSLFLEDEDSDSNECDEQPPENKIPANALVIPLNNYSSVLKGIKTNKLDKNDINSKLFNSSEKSGINISTYDKTLEQDDIEIICNKIVLLPEDEKSLPNPSSGDYQDNIYSGKNDDQRDSSVSVWFKCLECLDRFSSYSFLVNHIKEIHHHKTNLLLDERITTLEECGMSSEQQEQSKSDVLNSELATIPITNTGITYINRECRYCDITFDNDVEFKKHLKESHSLKCPHCRTLFFNQDKLDKHILVKHDHNTTCNICGKTFKSAAIRKTHEKCHEEKSSEICWICGAILKSKGSLHSHMKIHDDKEYACEICSKIYKTKFALTAHKRNIHRPTVETSGKMFQCQVCPEIFNQAESLWQHNRVHETKEDLKCEFCNKVFISPGRFNHHKKKRFSKGSCSSSVANNKSNNSNECDVCKRVFVKRQNLNKHRKYHFSDGDPEVIHKLLTEPEIKKCDVCGKSCFSKITLQYHKKVAHSIKFLPFQCSFCGKNLLTHNRLVVHERIHTGELPYTCSHCKKGFREPRALESHEMCHINEKPHVCQICSKAFKTRRRLVVHTLRHKDATHLRPYLCNLCSRRFVNKGCLQAHMNKFHSLENKRAPLERKYQCEECGKVYTTLQGYQNHKKRSHQITQIDVVKNINEDLNQVFSSLKCVTVAEDSENFSFEQSEVEHDGDSVNCVNTKTSSIEYLDVIQNDKNVSNLGLHGLEYLVATAGSLKGVSTFWNVSEIQVEAEQS